jgi:hypothetical protein
MATKTVVKKAKETVRPPEPIEIPRPFRAPEEATHFLLRVGGRNGTPCYFAQNGGVEVEWIPVRYWSTEAVRENWGNQHYYTKFSVVDDAGNRTQVGGWKNFRLSDPSGHRATTGDDTSERTAPVTSLVTSADGTGDFGRSMAILGTLRSMVTADANVQIAAERERSQSFMQMMMQMHNATVAAQAQPRSGSDDALLALVRSVEASNKETQRMLRELAAETEPEPEPEEEDDSKRIERLGRTVKKEGVMAAVREYMGEETALTIAKQMPLIKSKLPEVFAKLQGFLQTVMAEPPPPPAPHPVAVVAPPGPQVTPSSPPKVKVKTNGTNGAPRDSLTPTIK